MICIEMENENEEESYYSSIPKKTLSNAPESINPIVNGLAGSKKVLSTYNDDPEPERPPAKGSGDISDP